MNHMKMDMFRRAELARAGMLGGLGFVKPDSGGRCPTGTVRSVGPTGNVYCLEGSTAAADYRSPSKLREEDDDWAPFPETPSAPPLVTAKGKLIGEPNEPSWWEKAISAFTSGLSPSSTSSQDAERARLLQQQAMQRQGQGVPAWVWVVGGVAVAGLAVVIVTKK